MSGIFALRAVLIEALRGDAGLMALVNGVEDGGVLKMSPPVLLLGQLFATEWGARDVAGLSVRVPMTLIDRADRPDRLSDAAVRIGAVMDALPDEAGGWQIGDARFERARTVRSADGQWSMLIDYRVRISRQN